MSRLSIGALALAVCPPLAGCNAGLIALGLDDDDTPATDSPSTVSAFAVENADVSPAMLKFLVVDADGDDAEVSLYYQVAGGPQTLMTQLDGAENPRSYAGSRDGTEHLLEWDYAAEPDFPDDAGFTGDVTLSAQLEGSGSVVPGANAVVLGLGNDAPVVDVVETPADKAFGVIPIGVTLSDTSADAIAVRVEFQVDGDVDANGEGVWTLARPGGELETPGFAFVGLEAPAEGVSVKFFWDTQADLPDLERDVRMRITPVDERVEGTPTVSEPFRVDNNERTLVDLDNGLVAIEVTDRRGGIALPFSLRDPEGDDVHVAFQWRRPGQAFPELPADPAEVVAAQADPVRRRELQLCSEKVSWVSGRPLPVDATHLRLPELGTSAVAIPTAALVGRELELLRPSGLAVELTATWETNPLSRVFAAAPLGDGLEALVLDSPGTGQWRLRRLELATGAVLGSVGAGDGAPTALALVRDERTVFVALDRETTWRIERLDVASGEVTGTAEDGYATAGGVRGLAPMSATRVVFSVDDQLRTANFATSPPTVHTVVSGLERPWGVAADPLAHDVVVVAEYDADRVVAIHTERRTVQEVLARDPQDPIPDDELTFPGPLGVALDRGGSRLLVVSQEPGGPRQLRALNRRSPHDLDDDGRADPFVYVLADLPAGAGLDLEVGPDQLRLVADRNANELIAMGGLEQRRTIVEAVPSNPVVALDAPLAPPLAPPVDGPRRWRVKRGADSYRATPDGADFVFAWDSADLPQGGEILFRAVPFDSEAGIDSVTGVERTIGAALDARKVVLDANEDGGVVMPSLVDFDRDGDLDVFVYEKGDARVVLHEGPATFAEPVPLDLPLAHSAEVSPLVTDVDGDGRLDFVHVTTAPSIEVFYGWPQLVNVEPLFTPFNPSARVVPVPVPAGGTPDGIGAVTTADFDGDGRQDLVLALPFADTDDDAILVYLQTAPRAFLDPLRVGGGGATDNPRALASGDIDGDGLLDILAAINGSSDFFDDSGRMTVHFQSAPGVFDPAELILGKEDPLGGPGSFTTASASAVELVDLDGDGDLDAVASHHESKSGSPGLTVPFHVNVFTVHWQESPGVFASDPLELAAGIKGLGGGMSSLEVADLDADGDLDLLGQYDEGLVAFFARSPGVFDPEPLRVLYDNELFFTGDDPPPSHSPEAADLDGDGDLDVLYRNWDSGAVELLLQGSRGVEAFSSDPLILTGAAIDGANDSVVADLDDDGDMEVATANGGLLGNFGTNDLKIFSQNAPRNFASVPVTVDGGSVTETLGASAVEAADLDGDGDRDLATMNLHREMLVYLQEGGGFGDPQPLVAYDPIEGASPFVPTFIAPVPMDLDGDGDLDILATTNVFEAVVGFEQVAPGEFEIGFKLKYSVAFPGTFTVNWATAADLDLDGDLEILMAERFFDLAQGHWSGRVLVFEGLGTFQFASEPTILERGASGDVIVADVDDDGDLDIVGDLVESPTGIGSFDDQIVVNLRTPSGDYEAVRTTASSTSVIGAGGRIVRLADVDLDGDLDILKLGKTTFDFSTFEESGGGLTLIEQIAPGVFARHPEMGGLSVGESLRLEDVDGDGELDAVVTERSFTTSGTEVRILWGND